MVHTKTKYFGRQLITMDSKSHAAAVKTQEVDTTWFILPSSGMKQAWDIIIIIILFYTATYAPYRIAFADDSPTGFLRALEIFVDVVFISDIFVTFLTPYERYDGSLVYNHRKIAISYVTGAFWIDFIASFPTELF